MVTDRERWVTAIGCLLGDQLHIGEGCLRRFIEYTVAPSRATSVSEISQIEKFIIKRGTLFLHGFLSRRGGGAFQHT